MGNNETALQKAILKTLWLRFPGCLFERINAGVVMVEGRPFRAAPKGWSDIIGIVEGRFAALEVKVAPRKPTKHQVEFMARVRRCGGFACVVNSPLDAIGAVERAMKGESE